MVQSKCGVSQIALFEEKQGFNWQGMLETCLDSEIEGELTKIERKSSMDEFCSYVIQEFAFTFVLISLLRKHSLQLPSRWHISTAWHISNQKKIIFNCGKVWIELNNWKEVVLGTRFLKFKAILSTFIIIFPGWTHHIFVGRNPFEILANMCLFTSPYLNSLILLLNFCWWY